MGEGGFLMAVPDAGCGGGVGGSHFSLSLWLSGGEAEVLMAVPDASCGEERWGFS